tara:strand:+ start:7945 stop:10782 length:2838 start_codon:yes stop_codon:yes gene_type:complete
MSFENEIQAQNTQLYPVVVINDVWYSTNNVTVDGNYCKPILLNIPSIKQSIDVESRKFKISTVSLEFSNFEFEGVRFSDQLSETSLINSEVIIYFKSNNYLKQIYKGIVRKVTHNDEKAVVEIEDFAEQKASKELPQQSLKSTENIPDKYKNKPIPMVYGHVDRSPVVISENFRKYQADSEQVEFIEALSGYTNKSGTNIYLDSLQVDIDGEVHHIVRGNQYEYGETSINLSGEVLSGIVVGSENTADSFEEVSLHCRKIAKPKFSISNPKYNPDDVNEDFLSEEYSIDNINAITDGSLEENNIGLLGQRPTDSTFDSPRVSTNNERLLLSLNMDVTPQHDTNYGNDIIGFRINGYNIPNYLGDTVLKVNHIEHKQGDRGDLTSVSEFYDESYNRIWDANIPHYSEINSIFGFLSNTTDSDMPSSYDGSTADIRLNFYEESNLVAGGLEMPLVLFSGGLNNTFNIQFRVVGDLSYPEGDSYYYPYLELTGKINEIGLLVENESLKLFNNDFYANVEGRSDDNGLITNPIAIIRHLVEQELGFDAIDEDDYTEAFNEHLNWKFGFTVNEKIDAKELIEDIAKSTKCFPKFRNDGTFGFNVIKNEYSSNGLLIKNNDVISYSFKKTKPEQIYNKIDVQYKKDYAEGSYLKRTETIEVDGDYYGLDDSYLEFESDYIRDDATANNLASFLTQNYKNDHLIFNLKLPLKYINLEVGDLVEFESLFGMKAYGIDYTEISEVNGQERYPLFMITSTQKNLDSVSIECMQLHNLTGDEVEDVIVGDDGEQAIIPAYYFSLTQDGNNLQLVFEKDDNGTLLFNFTDLSNIFTANNYIHLSNDGATKYLFKIVSIVDNVLVLEPILAIGFSDNFTDLLTDLDLIITNYDVATPRLAGDVNNDGVLNILDIVLIVQHILGQGELTESQILAGDINESGGLNVLDIVELADRVLNQ